MKVVLFEGKSFEVVGDIGNGFVRGYRLKSDRTRNKQHKYPVTIPLHRATLQEGFNDLEEERTSRRRVQIFMAGLSDLERKILNEEVNKNGDEKISF